MQGALISRWTGIVPGREAAARQLMLDTNAFTDKLAAEGRITDFAWYLSAHSADGLTITRGEMEHLMAITADQEFLALVTRARLILTGSSWGFFATGDSVEPRANLLEQAAAQLG